MSKGIPAEGARSGLYRSPADVNTLRERLLAQGFAWFEIDCSQVRTKQQLLEIFARTLSVPQTFGYNWDALADSLQDLSWLPARGYVVSWRNGGELARRSPEDFSTALAILAAAAGYWRTKGKLFVVLLDAEAGRRCKPEPPPFPA